MDLQNGIPRTNVLAFIIIYGLMGNLAGQCIIKETGLEQGNYWNEIVNTFKKYWEIPSLENAKSVLTVLPVDWPAELAEQSDDVLDLILAPENYGILSLEALAGNQYSTEILIRLLGITDGYATTLVMGTLGAIVRINPKLFLSSLWPYRNKMYIKNIGYAVAGPDYSYNNHLSAFRYDLLKRIESLETVLDNKYANLKKACITLIRDELARIDQSRR